MSDRRDIVQHLKDDAAGMSKAATEQPDYYAVLGVYAMTCHEAADEIERLRALITELINAAADGGVMYQGITQRWWDAKEALRKAVGR